MSLRGWPAALSVAALLVAALAATLLWPLVGEFAQRTAVQPRATKVSYIVVPHPDDEFQAWSLLERDPSSYKVFILLTRGEETGYCDKDGYQAGWQSGAEPGAEPRPRGRWSLSCEQARLNSWRNFFRDQAAADPTLPGMLRPIGTRGPFEDPQSAVCRRDQSSSCASDTRAQVWVDADGRGALVAFNLGDGDLTRREVAWAVRPVKRNREALGIDASLGHGGLIGASFANQRYRCVSYPHPDHLAVHRALYSTDFGMEFQAAPTCADDPDVARSAVVSNASTQAAFRVGPRGERLGSHTRNYGWLYEPYYRVDWTAQRRLFHRHQEFWVRFAD